LNVRVVLLPDGEDPDSYSKKLGSSKFQEYLKAHTKDFISFKIDLLSSGTSNDPIKRAEAIREIVTSIALIPDPIKRSVYIKETGDLLKIQESVLLTELNKILIAEKKKRDQDRMREEVAEPLPEIIDDVIQASKTDIQTMVQMQERETIRLLLNYAENGVGDDQKVIDFLLSELDDVEFINPVYREIFDAFKTGSESDTRIDNFYFLENGSDPVKRAVADLMTSRYETSPHWSDKYHIYFPHEKEVIHDVAMSNVLRLKFRLIQKMMEENLKDLKASKDDITVDKHLAIHAQLKESERQLASFLGIVVSK
jgi:DNA primase